MIVMILVKMEVVDVMMTVIMMTIDSDVGHYNSKLINVNN